jgi:outer membrane protein OmpA-like peptidoglycan-associated protein
MNTRSARTGRRRDYDSRPMKTQLAADPVLAADHDAAARRRQVLLYAALAGVTALAGCATVGAPPPPPPPAPGMPPPAPVDSPPAAATPLAIERQWLQQWFEGTPVHIEQAADGTLTVDVPLEFSFDTGRSTVKPALAAVLDKVAQSLRRVQRAKVVLVAAPQDVGAAPSAASALGLQRAGAVRRHLTMRGIPNSRMVAPSVAAPATVPLRIDAPAG